MSRFFRSLRHATDGLLATARTEPNFRTHLVAGAAATALGLALGLAPVEWGVLALCVGTVTAAELFNTALERLADAVSPEREPGIGAAKDAAAAAVLVAAAASAATGAFLFVPKILARLAG